MLVVGSIFADASDYQSLMRWRDRRRRSPMRTRRKKRVLSREKYFALDRSLWLNFGRIVEANEALHRGMTHRKSRASART